MDWNRRIEEKKTGGKAKGGNVVDTGVFCFLFSALCFV